MAGVGGSVGLVLLLLLLLPLFVKDFDRETACFCHFYSFLSLIEKQHVYATSNPGLLILVLLLLVLHLISHPPPNLAEVTNIAMSCLVIRGKGV